MFGNKRNLPVLMGLLVMTILLLFLSWKRSDGVTGVSELSYFKSGGASAGEEEAVHALADSENLTGADRRENEGNLEYKIAITFDDGPHPRFTEELLDGLKERGVKATFFVTGEHAELHPEIIKRMSEEGHCVGNHTYSHMQLKSSNQEEFKKELILTNEIITGITGEEVLYVRPPYGSWDKKIETELNMFPVLWNVDPLDWCSSNVSGITEKVVGRVQENDIILMHDYYDSSVMAALRIVDELRKEGFEFVTVEEILFD